MSEMRITCAHPGCGKTTHLINRLVEVVNSGVPPEKVAFVTFTKAAAQVAKERAARALDVSESRLTNFRTIHSMAFRAVGANRGQMMNNQRYSEFGDEIGMNLQHAMETPVEGMDLQDIKDRSLVSLEQLYRNNKQMYDRLMYDRIDSSRLTNYMAFYTQYRMQFGYYDFTDLLELYLSKGCTEDVEVAFLDEMQDSTPLQWRVVFQAFKNASVQYIVGDTRQAIYCFSGSERNTLVQLKGKYDELDTSYRVPSNIMKLVNDIGSLIDTPAPLTCKSSREGGEIEYLNNVAEIMLDFDINKSYFFLSRGRSGRKGFRELCRKVGLNYIEDGKPAISSREIFEFEHGRYEGWEPEFKEYVQRVMEAGNLRRKPNIKIGTIHSVKGDEADRVVLLSDVPKLVHQGMKEPEVLEDEHCVFYVACSRAKEKLYIIEPQTGRFYPYILGGIL